MSSEVKRYDMVQGEEVEDNDGGYVLYTDYESLRLSHEETTKQLMALEDALERNSVYGKYPNTDKEDMIEFFISTDPDWNLIYQAIQNSRARKQNGT